MRYELYIYIYYVCLFTIKHEYYNIYIIDTIDTII